MAETHTTRSVAATLALGEALGARLRVGDLVALEGELGAGKTVLVRGIARGLGVADGRLVSSPTYVLVQEYAGRMPIYHVDLYRLADVPGELAGLGIDEMLQRGCVLVEWADRAGDALPRPALRVRMESARRGGRRITVERQ